MISARTLGLTMLALALIAAMVWLGLWQLGVYDDHQRDNAAALLQRAPIALDDALGPDAAFPSEAVGRPVTATGHYVDQDQFYVRGLPGSRDTYAVVTPLLTGSGSAILVVRGSSTEPTGSAPAGQVTVTGVLQPSQVSGSALDAGRVTDGIRISTLVSTLHEDIYAGYLIAGSSVPPDTLTAVDPPLGTPSRWAGIRNLLYAFQWWVFAGFVVFMWWRMVTDDRGVAQASSGT